MKTKPRVVKMVMGKWSLMWSRAIFVGISSFDFLYFHFTQHQPQFPQSDFQFHFKRFPAAIFKKTFMLPLFELSLRATCSKLLPVLFMPFNLNIVIDDYRLTCTLLSRWLASGLIAVLSHQRNHFENWKLWRLPRTPEGLSVHCSVTSRLNELVNETNG